ncbi:MAG: hypothetical protein ACR2MT_07965 [Aurantibacter sp.]
MKRCSFFKSISFSLIFVMSVNAISQITPGVYISDLDNVRHELKMSDGYMIHSIYEKSPARFIKTVGGFYTVDGSVLNVKLEFNSNYEADTLSSLEIPFAINDDALVLGTNPKLVFSNVKSLKQDLDGTWLFGTRGPDEGQERRGDENPRKTLKFLMDGRFQWIAYHVGTFKFSGTGGGSFSSSNGVYSENIEYFSRDDSRVGASLQFDYELKGNDWHHKGKNSKGEPMYEIWAKRK